MQDLDPHVLHTFAPLFFRAHPLRVILPKRPRFLRKDQGCSAKKQTPHRSRLRIKFNCCKCSLLKGTFWGLFSLYKNCFSMSSRFIFHTFLVQICRAKKSKLIFLQFQELQSIAALSYSTLFSFCVSSFFFVFVTDDEFLLIPDRSNRVSSEALPEVS